FSNTYFDMSQGDGAMATDALRGSWNQGEQWKFISARDQQVAVDGGSGVGSVELQPAELQALEQMAARGASDPALDPMTGAELGMADLSALGDPVQEAKAQVKKNAKKGSV
ncbi:MAG: Mn-containing catalase, partial [Polaromonas sp.]|nr:Mn-containing catalase [Polaromonas sp.]